MWYYGAISPAAIVRLVSQCSLQACKLSPQLPAPETWHISDSTWAIRPVDPLSVLYESKLGGTRGWVVHSTELPQLPR